MTVEGPASFFGAQFDGKVLFDESELREMGLKDLDTNDYIELRNHDISVSFIRSMRELGLTDLGMDDLVELRVHNITPRYVRDLR
jgi:hypothetical protein